MAKKKYGRAMKKIEPAQLTMAFSVDVGPGTQDYTIDLSQCASIMNRRFYRQGINWVVNGFKFISGSGLTGEIIVSKLPTTWVLSNSWEKSFRAWQQMNKNASDEAPSVRPKYLDFKIYADDVHHQSGFGNNLLPFSSGGLANAGEWSASKFVIPTAGAGVVSREVIATGASYPGVGASGLDAVSMIEGYASSRGLPNVLDPNAPADAADATGTNPENWMTALFNEGIAQDDEVMDDMISENNLAPYPFENDGTNLDTMYPGGANQLPGLLIHDFDNVTGTTIGGISRLKGGQFPCGLIRLNTINWNQASSIVMTIDLVPGDHRGYLCEPMTEM